MNVRSYFANILIVEAQSFAPPRLWCFCCCEVKVRLLSLLLLICCGTSVSAQKIKRVTGEYTYRGSENVSLAEAKRIALDRAKMQAVADAFGTIVSRTNATTVTNNDGHSNINFTSIGGSEVKGEWIETIGQPEYSQPYYEQEMLIISCKVRGRAREIISAAIDFKAKVLKNGTDDRYEAEEFVEGDDLYLSFCSPVSGWLTVYLVDTQQRAYCLLPYRNYHGGAYHIDANKRYVFFNVAEAPTEERPYIDEYIMTCSGQSEHNMLYVIFSPNQFSKAADISSENVVPRELSFDDFQEWLAEVRKHDNSMGLTEFMLTLKAKE